MQLLWNLIRIRMNKIVIRFALLISLSALIISSFMLLFVHKHLNSKARNNAQDELLVIARFAVSLINGDIHATLTGLPQDNQENYLGLLQDLQRIKQFSPNIKSLNTFRLHDGEVVHILQTNRFPTHDGEINTDQTGIDPLEFEFLSQLVEPQVHPQIQSTRQGSIMSAYAPIYTTNGNKDGILKIEYEVSNLVKIRQDTLIITFGLIILWVTLSSFIGWRIGKQYANQVNELRHDVGQLIQGDLGEKTENELMEISVLRNDIQKLGQELRQKENERLNLCESRLTSLEKRSSYLELSAQTRLRIESVLESDNFLQHCVDVIKDVFKFYFVGIFLVDGSRTWVELRAGTGIAGRNLVELGERFLFGEGVAGWVVENDKARISLDLGISDKQSTGPELPLTRSSTVLPLRLRDTVIGALVVLSDKAGEFSEAIVDVLQFVADQISISIDNHRLFSTLRQENQNLVKSMQKIYTQAWIDFLRQQSVIGYRANEQEVNPVLKHELVTKQNEPESTIAETNNYLFEIPVKIRGIKLGVLQATKNFDRKSLNDGWTDDEIRFIQELADRMATALDNARLYSAAKNRAERERLLAQITSQVRASTNLQAILQTAIEQLSLAFRVQKGSILIRAFRAGGEQFLDQRRELGYKYDSGSLSPIPLESEKVNDDGDSNLVVPIKLRGESIGKIQLEEVTPDRAWLEDELTFVHAVADQVALAVENEWLIEETQARAEREAAVAQIASRLRSSNDPNVILKTAVDELRATLRASAAHIVLNLNESDSNEDDLQQLSEEEM
jgi:GAF domain-containing protein